MTCLGPCCHCFLILKRLHRVELELHKKRREQQAFRQEFSLANQKRTKHSRPATQLDSSTRTNERSNSGSTRSVASQDVQFESSRSSCTRTSEKSSYNFFAGNRQWSNAISVIKFSGAKLISMAIIKSIVGKIR